MFHPDVVLAVLLALVFVQVTVISSVALNLLAPHLLAPALVLQPLNVLLKVGFHLVDIVLAHQISNVV